MPSRGRPEPASRRFVERFASALVEAAVPQMPALVLAALLATESGNLTADEIAERVQVSRAAISGAVSYLAQVGMVTRQRQPREPPLPLPPPRPNLV